MTTTRRDFLMTTASASLLTPAAFAQDKKINYCIVGLGRISLNEFMPGAVLSRYGKLTAIVSGHRDKAEATAAKYGIATKNIYDYAHFDEIAANPEIDAVYIALPNSMHAEYTIRAAKAGKHVLCEKPMANTVGDCQQMIAACRAAKKKLMVAYRCRLQPSHLRAIKLIRDGSIGDLRFIHAAYGFNIGKNEWRCNKAMAGGGPMMDVGIYALNACRYLTGEEPQSLTASSNVVTNDGRFTEVEENLFWNIRFPSGVVASCTTSYGSNCGNYFHAIGTKGWVRMDPAYGYDGNRFKLHIANAPDIDEPATDPNPAQFTREADHFATAILEDRDLDHWGDHAGAPGALSVAGEEGLRDMRLIEAIYRSAAATKPVLV